MFEVVERFGNADSIPLGMDIADDKSCLNRYPLKLFLGPGLTPDGEEGFLRHLRRWNLQAVYQAIETAAWRDILVSYVQTTEDMSVSIDWQKWMIGEVEAEGREVQTFQLETGHYSMITMVDEVVYILKEIVKRDRVGQIWLIDLAETSPPSVHLDGFDITLDATPPSKWLPDNMTLQHWDVRTEPPREWMGTYDVVHIRLFALVFDDRQLSSLLKILRKLLKPGGYLQWAEVDMSSCRIEKTHSSSKVDAMIELLRHCNKEYIKEEWSWCPKLPDMFLREGFENIRQHIWETPSHLLTPTHECSLFLLDSWVRRMMGGTGQGAKYRALIQQVEREASQSSVWKFTRWTVLGRKPFKDTSVEGFETIPFDKDAHPGSPFISICQQSNPDRKPLEKVDAAPFPIHSRD
ncbi:S-adenosyl-L-methionine-dependent methyltransferase [Aspergillus affinis]|uniref:S-adenosyl-L-methionine-dependent methyltransferase n=1 Tax=Aspergillus affinis TaxID=1070780 RepID=UPI0022FDE55C|nr:S-adenosyl-L-methionine-dependent methyltransferase [Aspergillus affinis]KAI9035229.1 S-adenosyl-L-methionine-dependent methyltransferase [Aspergillus affinis]